MAAHPPPVLPPFDYPTESIEEAVQEALSVQAQLKRQGQLLVQLARRQDSLNSNYGALVTAIDRMSDRQTGFNALASLMCRRSKKIMDHFKIDDVEDAAVIEAEHL